MSKLRTDVANIQRNKRFQASVIEVLQNRISVRLVGNGMIIRGLSFTGQCPVAGQSVIVNYSNGVPFIEANSVLATVRPVISGSSTPRVMAEQSSSMGGNISGPDTPVTDGNLLTWDGDNRHAKDGGTVPVGDVVGPSGAVDGHIPLFDTTTGKLLKDSGVAPSDIPILPDPIDPTLFYNGSGEWAVPNAGEGNLGGGGGGGEYLRRDASNDPVTGPLDINANDANALRVQAAAYTLGAEISTGSIPVTSAAGATISGLTIGNWYAVEAFGGGWSPWGEAVIPYPFYTFWASNNGGTTWAGNMGGNDAIIPDPIGGNRFPIPTMHVDYPSWGSFVEIIDEHYVRFYFRATTTSIKVGVPDYIPDDNGGALSWRLHAATAVFDEAFNVDTLTGVTTIKELATPSTTQVDNLNSEFLNGLRADEIGGGTNLGWFDAVIYGADPTGTDDSTSSIQDAIDAAAASGGGVVYFRKGIYKMNGGLNSPSNAQLVLPSVSTVGGNPITIYLLGEIPAQQNYWLDGGAFPTTGVIIKGTLNSGSGSLLGGVGPSGSLFSITQITVKIENILFEMPANPVLTCLNLYYIGSVILENVMVNAGGNYDLTTIVEPTVDGAYGIIFPMNGNAALVSVDNVTVTGFYGGICAYEHFEAGHLSIFSCKWAINFHGTGHTIYISRLLIQWCTNGLWFGVGNTYMIIGLLNFERYKASLWGASWCETVHDIEDPDNYWHGKAQTYCSWESLDAPLLINGASNAQLTKLSDISGGGTTSSTIIVNGYAITNVSNPPTQSEVSSAFGDPSLVEPGYMGLINDNGDALKEYLVASDGAYWWVTPMAKASISPDMDMVVLAMDTFTDSDGVSL